MLEDRLSALDASFLELEDESANMTVAGTDVFRGPPPRYEELVEHVARRLDALPQLRRRPLEVPLGLGRPRWVDDEHFRLTYHVRHVALPAPGDAEQLQTLYGRLMSQPVSRRRPPWEMWLVEGLEEERFAIIHKFHHALVDGIASVMVLETLLDREPEPREGAPPRPWRPRPGPSTLRLLAEVALERAFAPELAGSALRLVRSPLGAAQGAVRTLAGLGALLWAGAPPAPPTPYNAPVGPHRRFTWQRESLDDLKAVKDALEGSINDVVLATVAGALGRDLRRRGHATEGVELQAFVPVSLRGAGEGDDGDGGDDGGGANQVSGLRVPLPVGLEDPLERFARVHAAMEERKGSPQVLGGSAVIELTGLVPGAVLDRIQPLNPRQRFVNLVVTNVPGPRQTLYLLGRELEDVFPFVPLGANLALGIAIVSYVDRISFGISADADILTDVARLPADLHDALAELAAAAGVRLRAPAPEAARADKGRRRAGSGRDGTRRSRSAAAPARGTR